ncbi:MAG: DUF1430 domain-containing protein [Defluviitaleaceae bacterium]|nr:DUF1430 domain-containing protein [Defluviitaleaceae bacterium]
MKKILFFLFVIQLSVMSLYGTLLFHGNAYHSLFMDDVVNVTLNFGNQIENYERFLSLMAEEEIQVSRVVYREFDFTRSNVIFYTTDLTLNGLVHLQTGRFPKEGTSEFISTFETGELTQVGIIESLLPDLELTISGIENPQNFTLDGNYYLHTDDLQHVQRLLTELDAFLLFTEVWYFGESTSNFLMRGLGILSYQQAVEFVFISFMMVVIMIGASIQYVISQLKSSSIFLLHGYSIEKVIQVIVIDVLKLFFISLLMSYLVFIGYVLYMNQGTFILAMTPYFLLLGSILMLLYLMVIVLTVRLYLKKESATRLIKGKKPYLLMQLFNHGLKLMFIFFFLMTFQSSIHMLNHLNIRLDNLSHWELARGVYRINVSQVGHLGAVDFVIDRDYSMRKIAFYEAMSEQFMGFFMNPGGIEDIDDDFSPYEGINVLTSPHGNRITISPNFLKLNPIEALNGIPIIDQLVWDDNVFNLLVPERLRSYEEEIVENYLGHFYLQVVHVSNIYNRNLDLPLNETTIEAFSLNLIYVEADQYYFSFDSWVRPGTGGRILDPIAVIHTGNFDPSFVNSNMTSSFYFQTDALNPYEAILPLLVEHGLDAAIPRVNSVFDENARTVALIQDEFVRAVGFTLILVIANLTVTYHLMASYFERNKFKLFLKGKLGYSPIKRNQFFIVGFLGYTIPFVVIATSNAGKGLLITGFFFIVIDLLFALIFEKYLQKKSFSEIMKGER